MSHNNKDILTDRQRNANMKKLFVIILTLALALGLAGCTRGKGASTGSDLTQAEIDAIVEQMEQEQAAAQK